MLYCKLYFPRTRKRSLHDYFRHFSSNAFDIRAIDFLTKAPRRQRVTDFA